MIPRRAASSLGLRGVSALSMLPASVGSHSIVMRTPHDLFAHAARLLADGFGDAADPATLRLLAALGWHDLANLDHAERISRHNLLAAAARFEIVFTMAAPDAPDLCVFGAQLGTPGTGTAASACGVGLTPATAFAGCVGEGVEFLSQLAISREDIAWVAPPGDAAAAFSARLALATNAPAGWLQARDLIRDRPASVPAALCLRSRSPTPVSPPVPLSLGCAAGRSPAAAVLHGLLEVVERDAACLWWRGGVRPRGLAANDPALRAGAEMFAAVRRGASGRVGWVMDITSDIALPCLVAVSCDEAGAGVACGVAARTSRTTAARAAVLELCQMELAARLAQGKRRARGEAALGPADLAHLRRHDELNARRCALLQPCEPQAAWHDCAEPDAERALAHAVGHLRKRGIECYAVDLTCPAFAIAVFQVICPSLETEPSPLRGPRLLAAEAATGGGLPHTRGVPLF